MMASPGKEGRGYEGINIILLHLLRIAALAARPSQPPPPCMILSFSPLRQRPRSSLLPLVPIPIPKDLVRHNFSLLFSRPSLFLSLSLSLSLSATLPVSSSPKHMFRSVHMFFVLCLCRYYLLLSIPCQPSLFSFLHITNSTFAHVWYGYRAFEANDISVSGNIL